MNFHCVDLTLPPCLPGALHHFITDHVQCNVSAGSWQGAWPSVAGVIVAAAPIALLVAITCFSMQAAARASLRACSGGWHVHALVGAVLLAEHAALAAPQLVSAVPLLMGAQPYIAAVALVMLEVSFSSCHA